MERGKMSPVEKKNPPIKTVFLLQDLEFGGTQRYVLNLLKHIDRDLFAPELWILCNRPDMNATAKKLGIKIRQLSTTFYVLPNTLAKLAWLLYRHKPRILYTLTVVPNIWGRILGRMTGLPVIVTSYRDPQPKQYESWMWPFSTKIICNAQALKKEIIRRHRVAPKKVAVVPNAVDAEFWKPDYRLKSVDPTVVYAGRLIKRKDPLTLLNGFRLAVRKNPLLQIAFVGDGPLKPRLKNLVSRYGIESHVTFAPGQVDHRPYLRKSWVFAMTPLRDASPNAILEAMSSELPVVATSVGGIPELIHDGQTGRLIGPGDAKGLAEALTTILGNDTLRHSMAKKARERVLAYHSMADMVMSTEKILMDALNASKSNPIE